MLWTLKSLSSSRTSPPGLRRRLELRLCSLFLPSSLIDVAPRSASSSMKLSLCSWASSSLVREQSLALLPAVSAAAAAAAALWLGSRGSEQVSSRRTPSGLQLCSGRWGVVFWVSERHRCCLLLQEPLLSAVDSLVLLREPVGTLSLRRERRARSTLVFVSRPLKQHDHGQKGSELSAGLKLTMFFITESSVWLLNGQENFRKMSLRWLNYSTCNLTVTLTPSLNFQTDLWKSEDQSQCPHNDGLKVKLGLTKTAMQVQSMCNIFIHTNNKIKLRTGRGKRYMWRKKNDFTVINCASFYWQWSTVNLYISWIVFICCF